MHKREVEVEVEKERKKIEQSALKTIDSFLSSMGNL